jgi:hypothetical protein
MMRPCLLALVCVCSACSLTDRDIGRDYGRVEDTSVPRDTFEPLVDTAVVDSARDTAIDTSMMDVAMEAEAPRSYADEVLADKPILYLRLGGADPSSVVDQSEAKRAAHVVGIVKAGTPGALAEADTAFTFEGGYVELDNALDFTARASFTIECWARIPATKGGNLLAAYGVDGTGKSQGYGFTIQELAGMSPKVVLLRYRDSAYDGANLFGLATATWMHLVGVFDTDGRTRIYRDGVATPDSAVTMHDIVASPIRPRIGYNLRGDIDELAVYNGPLSGARVNAHYKRGKGL